MYYYLLTRSCVRAIISDRPGMGKSFYIKQIATSLRKTFGRTATECTIPIHGAEVTPDTIMNFLSDHLNDPSCSMYHLDIAPNVSY